MFGTSPNMHAPHGIKTSSQLAICPSPRDWNVFFQKLGLYALIMRFAWECFCLQFFKVTRLSNGGTLWSLLLYSLCVFLFIPSPKENQHGHWCSSAFFSLLVALFIRFPYTSEQSLRDWRWEEIHFQSNFRQFLSDSFLS